VIATTRLAADLDYEEEDIMLKHVSVTTGLTILTVLFSGLNASAQIDTGKHLISGSFDEGFWMVTVDFDGDGDADVIAASRLAGIDWFENNGSGGFTKHTVTTTFHGTWSIHAGDLDNDGDMDIAAGSEEGSETAWFEQVSVDAFTEHLLDATPNISPHSVWITDLDSDNDNDILVAEWTGGNIVWWENDGSGNFSRNVLDGNFGSAHSVTAGDLDNDGDIDVVASGGSKTAWWRNNGSGGFSRTNLGSTGGFGVSLFDVDQDGFLDIIRTERVNFDLDWFRNNGGAGFTLNTIQSNFGESWSASAGDFDRDGDIDIVAASYVPKDPNFLEDHISFFVNDGSNGFSEQVLETFNLGNRPRIVAAADIDGDGDQDVAALITRIDDLLWYEVLGSPFVPKSITVTQPNGGETLQAGLVFPIQWTSTGAVNNVEIDYSLDGGGSWIVVVPAAANNGSFNWAVPEASTDSALVRVSEAGSPDTSDVSDAFFTIVPTGVTVNTPNGGESYFGGTTQTITWSSTGIVDFVDLDYSLDDGVSWQSIAVAVANSGTFNWTVPNVTTNSARIRVTSSSNSAVTDISDAIFSIFSTSVTLLAPTADTLAGDSNVTILWTSTGLLEAVNLDYSLDNGATWISIVDSLPDAGSYGWTVPDIDASGVLLRVAFTADTSIFDVGSPFAIAASRVTVIAPNGGEVWLRNTLHLVVWSASATIDSVKIEHSINNGVDWSVIAAKVPNNGSFEWQVPDTVSEQLLVRISDAEDGVPSDVSDAVFTLTSGTLTVTSPNGGEDWSGLSMETIRWQSAGNIDSVRIEYSTNNGMTWMDIVSAAANTGEYVWDVPNILTVSARIRISNAANGDPTDMSDAVFAIVATSLTITSPNGGEFMTGLTMVPITWNSMGILNSLRLEYSVNNGADWQTIVNDAPNNGRYDWIVADVLTDSALIRISDAVDGRPNDVSDAMFSIEPGTASLTLTAPNGGEFWTGGSHRDITWTSAGPVTAVKLEYSFNNGMLWHLITDSTPNSGTYAWTVPDVQSDSALVRISEAQTGQAFDLSDMVFTIVSSSLTILSPNGGEIFLGGSTETITWSSAGGITQVRIQYSLDLGATWHLVEAGAPNVGHYDWTVPNVDSDSALVRISDTADGVPADLSNASFSIRKNPVGVSLRIGGSVPERFSLSQNYPNPFNPDTRIDFAVKSTAGVRLTLHNINGALVRTLVDDRLAPGVYTARWDGRDDSGRPVTSGLYVYKIRIGAWQSSKKLLLVK